MALHAPEGAQAAPRYAHHPHAKQQVVSCAAACAVSTSSPAIVQLHPALLQQHLLQLRAGLSTRGQLLELLKALLCH